jgi:cytochrome oxidase Cu insertion factor (SCO1/SenC/PrrC family)
MTMADKKPSKPKQKMSKGEKSTKAAESKKTAEPEVSKLPSRRMTFIALMVLISAFILVWRHYIEPTYFAEFKAPTGAQVQTAGAPKIGGPFNLVNQDGANVSEADFKGRYMLVYFGYTYCPDVCPTSLSEMADALDILGPKGDKITPVFITVDPERDDANALKTYVSYFHPRLVGLTGTVEQVKAAAKAYKAYFAKAGDGYDDDDYTMDHSSITYLMGPDGEFITHFGHGVDAEKIAEKLSGLL